jgi:hypothetical protein
MAASTAGAVKAYVEAQGLGVAAYRDGAPTNDDGTVSAAYPHLVIQEGIAYSPNADGDFGDQSAVRTVTELVQCDLYQLARTLIAGQPGSANAEAYPLHGDVVAALHGAKLGAIGDQRVHGCLVRSGRRWPIADNIVRHTIDLEIRRELNR